MKLGINERLKGKRLYKEVWKPVILLDSGESYEGLYEVSNMGRVRNVKTGKILKGSNNNSGYPHLCLFKNGKRKTISIHRLVAFAFVNNYFNGAEVDHIIPVRNGGKNIWINLRWVTSSDNKLNPFTRESNSNSHKGKIVSEETRLKQSESHKGKKHWNHGNTWDEDTKEQNMLSQPNRKPIICVETGVVYPSINQAGRELGVKGSQIRDAITHRNGVQTCKGYHWEYYEEVV